MSKRPNDQKLEFALLTHWKCIMCEMQGHDTWKHFRDYKAIMILFQKWIELIKTSKKDEDQEAYFEALKFEDMTPEKLQDDVNNIEDIRTVTHDWIKNLFPKYESDSLELAPEWGLKRIRELTQS